jgi:hypothetical protein
MRLHARQHPTSCGRSPSISAPHLQLLHGLYRRVLYGEMHVASYDWADSGAACAAQLPCEARAVLDASCTAADPPVVLFPRAGGNIHEFTAVTDCAVLDLMSPPYSTGALCAGGQHAQRAQHGARAPCAAAPH